jgi:hypothetical protein
MRELLAAAICLGFILPAYAADTTNPGLLFSKGQFDEARAANASVPATSPDYGTALRRLGTIALYGNNLEDADKYFRLALTRDPADTKAEVLLAESASRQGKFGEAADWFAKAGKPQRAVEFAAFGDALPYRIVSRANRAEVPFVQTDPLPALLASVNGHEGLFLIDTGGPEIALDSAFAASAGIGAAAGVPGVQGTFAGGKQAPVSFGRIGKFSLGTLDVADVPAVLLDTKAYASVAGGKPVAGVIGTQFLSRFLATIDYPEGKLVLEPRDAFPPNGVQLPFWLVGDHFMLTKGRLNGGHAQMFFVDSGLAGFAFTGPASTLADAGISVPVPTGGDEAPVFTIASLSLGDLQAKNLQGLYGPFPPSLETSLGVHVGGIVSHAFFRPYAISFDFKRMHIVMRAP